MLLAVTLTGQQDWLGALPGYWFGYYNSKMLYRYTDRAVEGNVFEAIKIMRRGFLIRLGVLSLVVVGIAHFQRAWLPSLIAGIAVGIPIFLILIMRQHILNGKG